MRIFDRKVREQLPKYIIQCLIATAALAVVLFYMDLFTETAVVASLGASCFIVFTMPHKRVSKSKFILGGYAVGSVIGLIGNLILVNNQVIPAALISAIAVGLSMFFMVILDLEHPPAAAHALGVTVGGLHFDELVFVLVVAAVILGVRYALRKWLIDLL